MTRIGDIGTANIVETEKPVAYYVSLALLKKKALNPYFLKAVIHSEAAWRELWHRTLHIAFPKKINMNEIKKVLVNYPVDVEEQTAIGNFFRNLDNTIALKKQQYEQTVNIKKAMLEKMFPKKGADVPEIRFDGFAEPWEIRKLGDVVNIFSGWSPSGFEIGSDHLFIKVDDLNYTIRSQEDSQLRVKLHEKYSCIGKGCTIFPKRGAAIMTNKVRILGIDAYMDTNMMALEPVDIDAEFLFLFIARTGLYKIADTSTVPQINNKHIEPYEIKHPVSQDEQFAIADFFRSIDILIETQREELEKLQNIKKACLSKMFV